MHSDDLTERLHLHLNKNFHFLSCGACGISLSREKWYQHLNEKHKTRTTIEEREKIQNLLKCYPPYVNQTFDEHLPVQGLLIRDGFHCDLCNISSSSTTGIKQHFYDNHIGITPSYQSGTFQRLTDRLPSFKVFKMK